MNNSQINVGIDTSQALLDVGIQADLDEWLIKYNTQRTHQGKMCCGRTPMETLIDGKKIWKEKLLN